MLCMSEINSAQHEIPINNVEISHNLDWTVSSSISPKELNRKKKEEGGRRKKKKEHTANNRQTIIVAPYPNKSNTTHGAIARSAEYWTYEFPSFRFRYRRTIRTLIVCASPAKYIVGGGITIRAPIPPPAPRSSHRRR